MQRLQNLISVQNFYSLLIILTIIVQNNAAAIDEKKVEDTEFWRQYGKSHLEKVLKNIKSPSDMKAKNVIIFIGDGMGITSITAGRIYKGQQKGKAGEEESLIFEDFPNTAMAKTYNTDKQVPDSAGTATAIFSGVKTRYSVIGMDATLSKTDAEKGKLTTIMDWAQAAGKRTGIVTTTRITHATPASSYAHVYHRDWECDSEIPSESTKFYKDIARQLIEDDPGKNMNVIMGGGLQPLGDPNLNEKNPVLYKGSTEKVCSRLDKRNLINEWLNIQPNNTSEGNSTVKVNNRKVVKTREELMNINSTEVEYLMGIFRNNHITYSITRQPGEPSLSEMVQQAIRVLDRPGSEGFVLMVEGGRIDQAHHQNYARAAMQEIIEMDAAVEIALNMTKREETLLIVTADHSHSLTLNGYPKRGNDILGFANKTEKVKPYETLTYANGPGYNDHRYHGSDPSQAINGTWIDVSKLPEETRKLPTYRHLATFPLEDETHGGEDVGVYAVGPGSDLVRGTFEQNYIAYVISYSNCIGPAFNMNVLCKKSGNNASSIGASNDIVRIISSILLTFIIFTIRNNQLTYV